MGRGNREAAHGGELEVSTRVQNVDAEFDVPKVVLSVVELLDGAFVLLAPGSEEEPLEDSRLPGPGTAEREEAEAVRVTHSLALGSA